MSLANKAAVLGPPRLVAEIPAEWTEIRCFFEKSGFVAEAHYGNFVLAADADLGGRDGEDPRAGPLTRWVPAGANPATSAFPTHPPMPDATVPRRPIRSFVLRQGRMSPAQQRALDTLWPAFGLDFAPSPPDFDRVFGRHAPRVLDIGFGRGETTAEMVHARPDVDFLAVDVHGPGVGSLLKQVAERGLTNVRVIRHDAVEVVAAMIAPASLAGIQVFFPDPWPKKRHHKRRLLQPEFVHLLATRMKPGAYLHTATDWEDYATQMLEVLSAEPLLANTAAGFAPRPDSRPRTKFETRGTRLGHGVWDLVYRRRSSGAVTRP
jgi:tRNA (guanine-N7-)-methyltransferase